MIYDIGYGITTVALLISLTIFIYFKSLRCLRNSIHCNFMAALLFTNLKWISLRLNKVASLPKGMCQAVVTLSTYFHIAIFFWMFVEGLYLFTIILWAFSAQKIRLWYYLIIGWGKSTVNKSFTRSQNSSLALSSRCWLPEEKYDSIDYIYKGPIIAVLLINVFFITVIIWVLVTKLKASNTLETRQYRKALKAIVVLFPLLGVTYILFIQTPYHSTEVKFVLEHVNALLQSLQGLFVAIFYCFLNGEVQSVIRQKINAIQESRTFSRYSKTTFFSSPRRSSCYALAVTNCNGKSSSDRKSTGSGSVQIKLSRIEPETEASASMMDNML
ncbi:unnamed protein product [Lymnaea stagnalis]|uniref:G-protein coupled receptors family 2 profile 2 domain-containing protein n=1 Tax=Lymnaea stagnalis TaxID=6523 RepID=A0AAV2HVQ4_LYMST